MNRYKSRKSSSILFCILLENKIYEIFWQGMNLLVVVYSQKGVKFIASNGRPSKPSKLKQDSNVCTYLWNVNVPEDKLLKIQNGQAFTTQMYT